MLGHTLRNINLCGIIFFKRVPFGLTKPILHEHVKKYCVCKNIPFMPLLVRKEHLAYEEPF